MLPTDPDASPAALTTEGLLRAIVVIVLGAAAIGSFLLVIRGTVRGPGSVPSGGGSPGA